MPDPYYKERVRIPLPMDLQQRLENALGPAYRLERELGGGGMSRVFVAEDATLRRRVVVKVLPPELVVDVSVERFKREIRVAAALQHPHIVPVHSAGEIDGVPYFTMPFVEGESLRARLARGALPIAESVAILHDIARALMYAHQHGIVHRDIKPANVLLSSGSATVTDFGIAKAINAARTPARGSTLTEVGTPIGTPAYMAPEQAAADPEIDHRADIYSYGCVAYELLTGHPPFTAKSPHQLMVAHMSETPLPVTAQRLDTPPALAELVMRCLAKDPANRPQHAAELVEALEGVTSGNGHSAMPSMLLAGRAALSKALMVYAAAFIAVAVLARAAIVAIGLPDWVFPGVLVVMALALPAIVFTAYVHHVAHRAVAVTSTLTGALTVTPSVPRGTLATMAVKASRHVSWRRTTLGVAYALVTFAVLVAGFMALRALGVGPFGSLLAAGRLAEREPLLLTDFTVTSGDSTLGTVVSQAIRTGLLDSKAIALVPREEIGSALQRMQRPRSARLTLSLARDIARREGIKAIIDGDVAVIGRSYHVDIRLETVDSNTTLTSLSATGDGPQGLFTAIDNVTKKLRARIGESLRAVQRAPALERVTTSSWPALTLYTAGVRAHDLDGDYPRAIALFERAVAIDSTFSAAWRKLAVARANSRVPRHGDIEDAAEHAYRYSERLSEAERRGVVAYYYGVGHHRDRAKYIAAYEAMLAAGDSSGINNLALAYSSRREFARAESLFRRLVSQPSPAAIFMLNLAVALNAQGKFTAADSVAEALQRKYPNSAPAIRTRFSGMYRRRALDSAAAMADSVRRGPNTFLASLFTDHAIDLAMLRGRLRELDRLLTERSVRGSVTTASTSPLSTMVDRAWADAWFAGRLDAAARLLDSAVTRSPPKAEDGPSLYTRAAEAFVVAGRPDRSRAMMRKFSADVRDTAVLRLAQPQVHLALGEIALAERRPREAIAEFQAADSLPDGPANACTRCLPGELGRAYDAMGLTDSAIVMFERFINTPSSEFLDLDARYLPAFSKRLGELYEQNGDRASAYRHYARFVELWKTADPELQPIVAEVRRRIARLGRIEP